jgi:HTH-type transcriptional regulator, competence development regulator
MRFGERAKDLRNSKGLSQRALGKQIGASLTYASKIENEKLNFGGYPSDVLIHRIAETLEADPDELLLLAKDARRVARRRVALPGYRLAKKLGRLFWHTTPR